MILSTVSLAIAIASVRAQSQCYFPDGTPTDNFVACNSSSSSSNDGFSSCCGRNDLCTTNGLCKNAQWDQENNYYWRHACTDPSWKSPNCPNYCTTVDNSPGQPWNNSHMVWACTQTTYCCSPWRWPNNGVPGRSARYTCCNDTAAVFDAGPAVYLAGQIFSTTQFPATSATATSTTTATATPTASSPSDPSVPQGLGPGTAAGIGVGASIGAILLIGSALWLVRRRRRRSREPAEGGAGEAAAKADPSVTDSEEAGGEAPTSSSSPVDDGDSAAGGARAWRLSSAHLPEADGSSGRYELEDAPRGGMSEADSRGRYELGFPRPDSPELVAGQFDGRRELA
ncbi:uncharacterized protein K489DRAFT_375742 [Dissoconium aciculare CBS 342.82]|uniref:Uncharacterized protein n=1 Tax=Dissoconium aciculare CBS 342.82 TaxID=1314786 RepID=A0A6J3MI68_9PEZI|nr:uncharacterized protein K489DRAFT_375742 [Dissoconium aciculare CBS 342.82]KAF1827626.1 hypothetical protein K489DRAFT_375742 [Dissoconium aciculare CBS 342.82]